MANASGTRTQLSYVAEVTKGVTPGTPTMKVLRATSRNINAAKNTLETAEVRSDRMIADFRHGVQRVEGSIGFELSVLAYNDFLEAAFASTFAAVTLAGSPNLAATTSPDTFVRATGSFVGDGFRPGDYVTSTGFSNTGNNGTFLVTAVTATVLTIVTATPLTTESSGSGKGVAPAGTRLSIGTTMKSFSIERRFPDIAQYETLVGVTVNSMALSIKPEAIVNGTFTMTGMKPGGMSGTSLGSPTAAPTHSPFDAFSGVMYEGGTAIAFVTGLDVTLDNNRTLGAVVGSKYSPDIFEGQAKVTGTMMAYFQDAVLYNKFINETESSIYLKLLDPNGTDFHAIVIPRVKYNGAPMDPPQTGPVIQSMPFVGLYDSVSGTSLSIQKST